MESVLQLHESPKEFKIKRLGSGQNGTCYLTSDNRVFKEYHTKGMDDKITRSLLNLNYDGFNFPRQLVFIDGIFKGYLKDYVEGDTLDKINALTEIRNLVSGLCYFEDSLMDLSYEECLYVYDLNLHNLIYSNGKIYDIDTDPIAPFDFPFANPYYENRKELANALERDYMRGPFKSSTLNDLVHESLVEGISRTSLFIIEAIKEMEKDTKIKTIKDYKKGLVLLRK